jgi:hypothetical protein
VVSEIGNAAPLRIMARDEHYKYWVEEQQEFLFDLTADPLEMNNLAGLPQNKDALSLMREKLLTHLRSTQVNYSEGYKPKVQRMREAEGKSPKTKKKNS